MRAEPPDALLTPAEIAVLDALDERETVDTLIGLVRIPSVTGSDAESEVQRMLARHLADAGLEIDLWEFDLSALEADPDFPGTEAPRSEGIGLVGVSAGEGSPALVLQGHVDVAPIGDLGNWSDDPFSARIQGGVLHGRGACDMKAGVAANLAVARALTRSGLRFERRLAVHSVVSEEDGGLGAFATLRRGHTGDAAVITEPTSGRIITASAGALTFRLEVTGRAAHGSTRLEGVSAFEAFLPVERALRDLERHRNREPEPLFAGNPLPYGISIGTIRAGDWASSVPDLLVAEGRLGVRLGEDPTWARQEFEEAIAAACAQDPWLLDHPVAVSWPGGQFASGRLRDDDPLIEEVGGAVAQLTGTRPRREAAPYGSDLRLYSGLGGIPTLHYGPGDIRFAHSPREQVELAEIVQATRALALLAVRRLDGHH